MEKKRYDIWQAGFFDNGDYQPAMLLAKGVEADSFVNAVRKWYYTMGVISLVDEMYGPLEIKGDEAYLYRKLYDNWHDAECEHCK